MKNRKFTASILCICIFGLPILSLASGTISIREEIQKFDLSAMKQYAGDWQNDTNSGPNILKRDQEAMEKNNKSSGTTGSESSSNNDYVSFNNSSEKPDIDIGTILMGAGCISLLAAVIIVPLVLLTN